MDQFFDGLAALDRDFANRWEKEIFVVDGGSTDEPTKPVSAQKVRALETRRGRGPQMHADALASTRDVLWFVHADTMPPLHALEDIRNSLRQALHASSLHKPQETGVAEPLTGELRPSCKGRLFRGPGSHNSSPESSSCSRSKTACTCLKAIGWPLPQSL